MDDLDGKETIENYFRAIKEIKPKFYFLKMCMVLFTNHIKVL